MVEALIIVAYLFCGLVAVRVVYQKNWLGGEPDSDLAYLMALIFLLWPVMALVAGVLWFVKTPRLFGSKK